MKQAKFEALHQSDWTQFESWLQELEQGKPSTCTDFPNRYRQVCQQLSLAQSRVYSPHLLMALNQMVVRGHQQLYRSRQNFWVTLWFQLAIAFPVAVRENKGFMWLSTALFAVPLVAVFLCIQFFPDTVYVLLSPEQVADIEGMYSPSAEHFGRNRDADSDIAMFGHYIWNNIGIAFKTFAGGLIFGLGSAFVLLFNGVFIGAVISHLDGIGFTSIYPFIIGHGSFELTAICLSGGAGLKIGWSLISPKNLTRISALKKSAHECIPLMIGNGLFLFIAAFIEAFWSSSAGLGDSTRFMVGGILWLLVFSWLFFAGRDYQKSERELIK